MTKYARMQMRPKHLQARLRNFTFKDGSIIVIHKIPLHEEGRYTWYVQLDRSYAYLMQNLNARARDNEPTGSGHTLREAMGELRLKLAIDRDPKIKNAHKKILGFKNEYDQKYDNWEEWRNNGCPGL